MTSRPMIDAANPVSAQAAKQWNKQYGIKTHACYTGGAFVSPNTWTPALASAYRKAGIELLPIYVGQQNGLGLGSGTFTHEQGVKDGLEAVRLAKVFGFLPGFIALDVESATVDSIPQLRVYVQAWCEAVRGRGFWPGVYCPARFVTQLEGTACAFIWVSAWRGVGALDRSLRADDAPGVSPTLWPKKRIWQYDTGSLDSQSVDFSAINFQLQPAPWWAHLLPWYRS